MIYSEYDWRLKTEEIEKLRTDLSVTREKLIKYQSQQKEIEDQMWQWKLAYEKILVELLTGKDIQSNSNNATD